MLSLLFYYMVSNFIQGVERWHVFHESKIKSLTLWPIQVHVDKINARVLSNKTTAKFFVGKIQLVIIPRIGSANDLLLLEVMNLLEGVSFSSQNNKWKAVSGVVFLF